MFGTHDLWAFVAASFLLWLTPGPDTMYILARSVAQGRRAGVMSALGIGSGLLIHTLLAAFGLSAILAASAWAFAAVKTAGAVYLIYLGLQALWKKVGRLDAPSFSPLGSWRVYRQGVVSNTLNPKVAIFFLAFLPQFVAPDRGGVWSQALVLGFVFVGLGLVTDSLYALAAGTVAGLLRRKRNAVRYGSGAVFIALGATASFAKRT